MSAIGCISVSGYPLPMPKATKRAPVKRAHQARAVRDYPNRIHELTKIRSMTYADVGDHVGAHSVTIAKLATGGIELTHDWMKRLAAAFNVDVTEIISKPIGAGLRRVRVTGAIRAGAFAESHDWPEDDRYDVMVPDVPALRRVHLYGGQVEGESMNLRYPAGSVVIMSSIAGAAGSEIAPGRRYHVRITRADGMSEDTIKTLVKDGDGRYWLKPESSSPEFQTWIALDEHKDATVEVIGRVRFAVQRED